MADNKKSGKAGTKKIQGSRRISRTRDSASVKKLRVTDTLKPTRPRPKPKDKEGS